MVLPDTVYERRWAAVEAADYRQFIANLRESGLDAFPGLGAGPNHRPELGERLLFELTNLPLTLQIRLVQKDDKRRLADRVRSHLVQGRNPIERDPARPIRDQKVPGRAAQERGSYGLEVIVAVDIPQDDRKGTARRLHHLLVYLDADGGVILLGEDTADKAGDKPARPEGSGADAAPGTSATDPAQ